jgi:large subunit ribosomal protein L10
MVKAEKNEQKEHKVPSYKIESVKRLAKEMSTAKTVLIASTKKLPSSQFHEIKKKMRGTAEIAVAKKSIILRSIDASGKPGLDKLKQNIGADIALFFSDVDAFTLSGMLADNQSPIKAKAGDIAPEDITIEPGPTDLVPGPAISELSGVGLKVAVENGKLAVKIGKTVAKAGEAIKENVAGVLSKLNIMPMKVGFEPIAAFDASENKVYVGIRIDKKSAYENLKSAISKSLGFAVSMKYVSKETLGFFLGQAAAEENALAVKVSANSTTRKEGE